jgi:tetratricopeptide (TPR) repeat protein
MKKERLTFLDFLKSGKGCLVVKGFTGAGKSSLIENVLGKYLMAGRAVNGVYRADGIGMECEPLVESFTDLVANLTQGQTDEVKAKRRKILVASTRRIRKGEREATIVLLHDIYSRLRTRLGESFDSEFYGFLNIQPKDEDGVIMTLPEPDDYQKNHQQVFINAAVHLVENIAGYLKRSKMKFVLYFPRAQNILFKALANVANVVSRSLDNVYFIMVFDAEDSATEKINFAAALQNSRLMELSGVDSGCISNWYSALKDKKPSKEEISEFLTISQKNAFYLGFLMENPEILKRTEGKVGPEIYAGFIRRKIEQKGKKFTRFMEQYSLLLRIPDITEMTAIFPFSDEELGVLMEKAESEGILVENGYFSHPLIKKHLAESIDDERRKAYYLNLGEYYEEIFRNETDKEKKFDFKLMWSICHHYFHSSEREKSYSYNTFMAQEGFLSGSSDVAMIGYERALSDAMLLGNDEYRISVIEKLVKVLEKNQRWVKALELHNMLVDHFTSAGDVDNKCIALQRMAAIYQFMGDFDSSLKYYNQTLRIYKKNEEKENIANTLMNIGTLYQIKEDFEDAIKNYSDAKDLFEESDNKKMTAMVHHKLASIYHLDYKYTKALGHYNKSQKIFKEIKDKNGYGETLHQMANIHFLKKKYESAAKYYGKSLEILEEVDSKKGVAEIYFQMGVMATKEKKYQESLERFNKSLNIFREISDIGNITNTIRTLGDTYNEIAKKQIGDKKIKSAKETLKGAINIFTQIGDKDGIEEANFLLEDAVEIEGGKKTVDEFKSSWA